MTTTMNNSRHTLGAAVRALASVCDGARSTDESGFNGPDSALGKSLALVPELLWDPDTSRVVWEMLHKYRAQLATFGIDYALIPEPVAGGASRQTVAVKAQRVISVRNGTAFITFRYNPDLVAQVKRLPDRRWMQAEKCWSVPANHAEAITEFAQRHGFTIVGDLTAAAAAAPPVVAQVRRVTLEDGKFVVEMPWITEAVQQLRSIPQREWYQDRGRSLGPKMTCWGIPARGNVGTVVAFAREWKLTLPEDIEAAARQVEEKANALKGMSLALDADITIEGFANGLSLLPYQRGGVAYIERVKRGFIADEMGLGKFLPNSAKVLTPQGWVANGRLQVGDLVIGREGKPTEVLGVFPQGEQPIVKVTFSDGTTCRCSWDHLWTVQHVRNDGQHRYPGRFDFGMPGRWRVMTTRELVDAGLTDKADNRTWRIPMVESVHYDPVALPLEPYALGVLLGNGHLHKEHVSITGDREVADATGLQGSHGHHESEGITLFYAHDPEGELRKTLTDLGLLGKRAWEKFVPDPYLRGTPDDRLALFQGLMDTDGHAMEDGGAEFSSTSPALVDAVMELTQSLGGVARGRRWAAATYTYKGERRQGWPAERVNIKLPAPLNPFRCRKAVLYRVPTKYQPTRVIVSVEEDGVESATCIKVAAPDQLYVTESFIVTHNTIQGMAAVHHLNAWPVVCVVPAAVKINWAREWRKWLPGRRVEVIDGTRRGFIGLFGPADVYVVNYDILGTFDVDTNKMTGHLIDFVETIKPKALIVDESHFCFVAGTPVDTTPGPTPIEALVVGDSVLNAVGVAPVTAIGNRQVTRLVRLTLSDGQILTCSDDHPFFTSAGVRSAHDIKTGDFLWQRDSALRVVREGSGTQEEQVLRQVLLSELEDAPALCAGSGVHAGADSQSHGVAEPLVDVRGGRRLAGVNESKYEGTKSDGRSLDPAKGERIAPSARPQTAGARREWARTDFAGAGAHGAVGSALALPGGDTNQATPNLGVSDLLQGRSGVGGRVLGGGSRWDGPPVPEATIPRPKEGRVAGATRVDRVEILQPGDFEFSRLSGGADSVTVYNLSVGQHPSFAVGGVLVHNCKSPSAARTQAVRKLANAIREEHGPDAIITLLSGTPLLNKPDELLMQLDILGRLAEFGGSSRFKTRYCKNRDNLVELHDRLRASCYVRRVKKDVLPDLPAIRRIIVDAELDPAVMADYQKAEEDVAEFLAARAHELALESGLDDDDARRAYWEKKIKATAAEHLVLIGTLKQLLAKAKMAYAKKWINNFLASTEGKLLVFGEHKAVVGGLAAELASPKVDGDQTSVQRQMVVDQFQTDAKTRLCVLNMQAGGVGLTLTAAESVAFIEQGWTPAVHDQSEGRCYGRVNEAHGATSYYLLAQMYEGWETIDSMIFRLIQEKREVVDAVTDGKEAEGETSVLGEVVLNLARRGLKGKAA